MFVYKTQAEIDKMTDQEAEVYAVAKRAHEAKENKDALEAALKTAKEELEKDFSEKTAALDTTIKTLEKQLKDADEVAIKQGEAITALKEGGSNTEGNGMAVAKNVVEQLKQLHKDGAGGALPKTTVKTADSADTAIAVNTHNSIAGAIGALGNYMAQLIPGIFRKPVPTSNILDFVKVVPLDADRIVAISQTETVSILVTAECTVKPKSNSVWASVDAAAEAVATTWKTTTKMRRFFPMFVTAFMDTLRNYFDKKIPQLVLTAIRAAGTAFTAVPAQAVQTAPNNWDAMIAVIASLIKLGYSPNVAKMSVFAWENMVTKKSPSDGHYMLQNNGSINLLDKTVSFGNVVVKIEPDVEIGDDELIVGDLSVVMVGLDSNLEYMEYFANDDGDKNMKSHLLEKFIAIVIPTAVRTGIVVDTFTNVKTAITAP